MDSDWSHLDCLDNFAYVVERNTQGDPVYAFMNAYVLGYFGFKPEDVVGVGARELFGGPHGEMIEGWHRIALEEGTKTTYEISVPVRGGKRLFRNTLIAQVSGDGDVLRLIGSGMELAGDALVKSIEADLVAARRDMEELIYAASLKACAPTRCVDAIALRLKDGFQDLGDGKIELITALEHVSKKAVRLIDDVLVRAQGALFADGASHTFEMDALVSEILDTVDPMHDANVSSCRVCVEADRTTVQAILQALIEAGLKQAEGRIDAQPLRLMVNVHEIRDPGFFQISVRDNGRGFDDNALRFLNGDNSRAGTGIGLVSVRRLLMACGGTVSGRRQEDGAALVTVKIAGRALVAQARVAAAE